MDVDVPHEEFGSGRKKDKRTYISQKCFWLQGTGFFKKMSMERKRGEIFVKMLCIHRVEKISQR